MNKITQYRPAYFDGFENEVHEFETLDELLRIPFVKHWTTTPNFYRFSFDPKINVLMAELREGFEWWVVGRLQSPIESLPIWTPKYPEPA